MTLAARVIGSAAGLLLILPVLTGCATSPAAATESRDESPPSAAREQGPLTVAVVGDSITEAGSVDFAGGEIAAESWVTRVSSEHLEFVGGWARGGASTADMRAGIAPLDPDVLVILAGTNDLLQQVPFEVSAANLVAISRIGGGDEVAVVSLPPLAADPSASAAYNRRLAGLADDNGWLFLDASAVLRDGDDWSDGATADGVHPTPRAQAELGLAVRAELERGLTGEVGR